MDLSITPDLVNFHPTVLLVLVQICYQNLGSILQVGIALISLFGGYFALLWTIYTLSFRKGGDY